MSIGAGSAMMVDCEVPCADPSRYRYQRGCRCAECRAAQAAYKRAWLERQARSEGREYGTKPCLDCGETISTLDGSTRKTFCDGCSAIRLKERQAKDGANRREEMRSYLREYYRNNKEELLVKQREYYEAHREQAAAYQRRRRPERRAQKRDRYVKKNTPTVHERALEAFGYRNSNAGFRLAKCKCGCGMYVNAAHVAVARLFRSGYTRNEIAARLGVHPVEVSFLKLDGESRTWAWYRRGHGNLIGLKSQPAKARRRLSKEMELRVLIDQQDTEAEYGERQKSITGRSLDAVIGSTEGLKLVDLIAAPTETGNYSDQEESFLDWLDRHDFDLGELTERCLTDTDLASALRECIESGSPTDQIRSLLLDSLVADGAGRGIAAPLVTD